MNGFVYFIKPVGADGPIKIGYSYEPRARLGVLLTWSPVPLETIVTIPGSFKLERNLQDCFADCHSHREWFHPVPRLLAGIEALKAGAPVGAAFDLSDRRGSLRSKKWAEAMKRRGTPQETIAP